MIREYLNSFIQNKNVAMFVTACVFMAGILSYFHNCGTLIAILITTVLLVMNIRKYVSFKYVLLWAFIFYFGFFNASLRIKNSDELVPIAPKEVVLSGRIESIPVSSSPEKSRFFFKVFEADGHKLSGKTLVNITDSANNFSNLNIGSTYSIRGKLRTPFKASNPSQFDYGKYLRNFDTYTVFYSDNSDCKLIQGASGIKWKFLQELNNVRSRIISTHALYLKSPNLEILGGIVFGDDAIAPPDYIKDTFKNSGLLHILAASGMNVAFIYGFWYFILRRLRVPMKLIIISGMGVVILYTFMTGLGASVVRAALMLLFVLAGKLIDRDSHSISLLAFVAALMLLYNPAYINDVGFQLSFIVTFGLLTTANVLMEKVRKLPIPDWISAEILVPIVSQFWVIPLQMFYFNSISSYAVLANISIMPFLSIISFGGFVSSVLAILTPIAKYVCLIFDFVLKWCLDILVIISNFFSELPNSIIQTTHPSVLQVFLYYLILLGITMMFKFGFNKKLLAMIGTFLAIILLTAIPISNNRLDIIAFDVQNADAFLIKTPNNKYFMIDTGKAPYNGGKSQASVIILKYLKDRGIKELEGLIITHFDSDHSGGAVDLMNNLQIKKVYINSDKDSSMTSKLIYKTIKDKSLNTEIVHNGSVAYDEKNVSITNYIADEKQDNEHSIITLLSYGDFQILFMGDAGVSAYEKIKNSIARHDIEVFKVGHHGARGVVNETMLNDINPDVSIISTGRNNFGHPNLITLDVLRNTDIYRTDKNNSVKISVGESEYDIFTYDKDHHKYRKFKTYSVRSK